jgi:hypothetical protein
VHLLIARVPGRDPVSRNHAISRIEVRGRPTGTIIFALKGEHCRLVIEMLAPS